MDIQGAAALVTGGASGLGAEAARKLAAAGATVTILDVQDDLGSDLATEIGGRFVHTDVTSEIEVTAAVETAASGAPLRVVVNCAGVGTPGRTIDREGSPLAIDSFRRVIDINLNGTFNVISQAAAAMAHNEVAEHDERGVIVNTASVAAFEGQIGQAAYAASKGGIVGLTLPVARDLSSVGIRVVTIAPGIIRSPLLYGLGEKVLESLAASVPFPKRLGEPEDFASLVLEVVRNGYLNGTVIRLDGALRMGPR